MSTPFSPQQGTSSSNSTRQLLEELDVLMQQMLAVPVNELAEDSAEPPPEPEENTLPPAPEPLPPPRPMPEMIGSRLVTAHEPSVLLPPPHRPPDELPSEWDLAKAHEIAAAAEPPPLMSWLPSAPKPVEPAQPAPGEEVPSEGPRRRPIPNRPPPAPGWWVRSLLWSNRTFDQCTSWLGPPGRWLRGSAGRTLLGWLGIGLLLAALAWALANSFDWTW